MRETDRSGHLRRKYGITEDQYLELLEKQDFCCAICGKHESSFTRKLAVEHNHRTGEIRGLVCNYDNHRVIGRHTDADLMQKVADYLRQGTGLFVPKKKRRVRNPRKERTSRGKTARPKRPHP